MAAFDVQEFIAQMVDDGARPNLFKASLSMPAAIANLNNGGAFNEKFTFMCRATQLPASTVGIVSIPFLGRQVKFPGNRTFANWTVTIINDEDFVVRNAIETWLNALNSHVGNARAPIALAHAGYTANGSVDQLGKSGDGAGNQLAVKTYNFVGLFPVESSVIELDWGTNDTAEEFSVTFAYQWWESDTTDSSSGSDTFNQTQAAGTFQAG